MVLGAHLGRLRQAQRCVSCAAMPWCDRVLVDAYHVHPSLGGFQLIGQVIGMSTDAYEWLAFQGKRAEDVRAAARLRETGVTSWAADGTDQIWATVVNDWYVVLFTKAGHDLARADSVARLSKACTVVACLYAEDQELKFAESSLYQDGQKVWRVSQVASGPLKVEGTAPEGLSAGPLGLAFQACGYRHNSGRLRYAELVPLE